VGNIVDNSASIRTYERGVEDETFACGTGTVASAVVLGLLGKVKSPVKMKTHGGEVLTVHFSISGNKVTDVYLQGEAHITFEGKV
jgi:diaminopimelate epimerase